MLKEDTPYSSTRIHSQQTQVLQTPECLLSNPLAHSSLHPTAFRIEAAALRFLSMSPCAALKKMPCTRCGFPSEGRGGRESSTVQEENRWQSVLQVAFVPFLHAVFTFMSLSTPFSSILVTTTNTLALTRGFYLHQLLFLCLAWLINSISVWPITFM